MDELERFSALIGHIYEAANAPDKWRDFAAEYIALFSGTRAVVQIFDKQNFTVNVGRGTGYDPAFTKTFVDHYQHISPFVRSHARRTANRIMSVEELLPPSEFQKTEYYNDWWKPQGLKNGHNTVLFQSDDRFMIFDVTDENAVPDPRQLRYDQLLIPHMQRSAQISRQIAGLNTDRHMLVETLERLTVGVLLLDKAQRLIHANRIAMRHCSGDGIRIGAGGKLYATYAQDRAALKAALARVANFDRSAPADPGAVLTIKREQRRPLSLLVSCIPAYASFFEPFEAAILVFIKAPEDRPTGATQQIASRYGLTQAESRLLDALAQGVTLSEYAEQRSLSINTVKVQLRALLAKTDTRRQSELLIWLNAQAANFASFGER